MNEELKREMESDIRSWAEKMVSKYDWLVVKYEYSDRNLTYMINCIHPMEHDEDDDYNRDCIDYYDYVVKKYGEMFYPVMTCNSELFYSTDRATIIKSETINNNGPE